MQTCRRHVPVLRVYKVGINVGTGVHNLTLYSSAVVGLGKGMYLFCAEILSENESRLLPICILFVARSLNGTFMLLVSQQLLV